MSTIWTPEEVALALKLKAEGVPHARIGAKIGRSKDAVQLKLGQLDSRYCRNSKSTPETDAKLLELRREGQTYLEISKVIGRSETWTQRRGVELGALASAGRSRGAAASLNRMTAAGFTPFLPRGYGRETRAWALSHPLNPEAGLILVHLVERGDMTTDDVRAVLPRQPRKSHKSQGASA